MSGDGISWFWSWSVSEIRRISGSWGVGVNELIAFIINSWDKR